MHSKFYYYYYFFTHLHKATGYKHCAKQGMTANGV